MLNENLKMYRKDRGFSQEQLSVRLNVVRQTISKWEKGLSVPDAEMMVRISEVLKVSVSDLLGEQMDKETNKDSVKTIALELEKLNELLATQQIRKKSFQKKLVNALAILLLILFIAAIYGQWNEMFYELGQNIYQWLH